MSIEYNKDSFTRADFPDDRTYEAACILQKLENLPPPTHPDPVRYRTINICKFILEDDCLAAKYATPRRGFRYRHAVEDHFTLPCELEVWDCYETDDELLPNDIMIQVGKHDPALAIKIWLWLLETFMPYRHIETGEGILLIESVLEHMEEIMSQEINDLIISELEHNPELLSTITTTASLEYVQYDYIIYRACKIGKSDTACRVLESYLDRIPETTLCRKMIHNAFYRFADFYGKESVQQFEAEIWQKIESHPYWSNPENQQLYKRIQEDIADYYVEYDNIQRWEAEAAKANTMIE